MRFLGPAALTAASLVLFLAAEGGLPEPEPAATTAAAAGAGGPTAATGPAATDTVELAAAQLTAQPARPGRSAQIGRAQLEPASKPVVLTRKALPDTGWAKRRESLPQELFTGEGFDACTAPSLDALRAWRGTSPYGALGIYVSGAQRACDQPRLTADWVSKAREMGWRLIPTHVGLQAPCSTISRKTSRIDPARAAQQGRDEAAAAVRAMKALGLRGGSPVYLDIESYPRESACSQAVVEFTLGWTQALHKAGYRSGFYSSTDSGVADLAAAARAGSTPLPDAVWYARWDGRATTTDGAGALGAADLWRDRSRIHQYQGNVQESYGGVTLNIDRNRLDAPVAR
ncbi:DUF1906 domain-containing protein [Kitasatospora terrestris]|uniref:Rv2525c-like glycoside hydrolase-like domain-containing protein n=1 Tax=Kitasatospora terrestris TaxID=258051 RepID=A0ABP9DQ64_9ACTN